MPKVVWFWVGGGLAVALMVAAMWVWRFAPELAVRHAASDPYRAKLGIRGLAVALAAAAQVLLLAAVIGRIYPVRLGDKLFGATLTLGGLAALGVALVIGWSAR